MSCSLCEVLPIRSLLIVVHEFNSDRYIFQDFFKEFYQMKIQGFIHGISSW